MAPLAVWGRRILYLTRWYNALNAPSAHLYLQALDQNSGTVQRLHWAWQYLLPTEGTVLESQGCLPKLAGEEEVEAVVVAGPVVIEDAVGDAAVAIIALSCQGRAVVFATSVAGAPPSASWRVEVPLASAIDVVSSITVDARQPQLSGASVWLATAVGGLLLQLDAGSGAILVNGSLDGVPGLGASGSHVVATSGWVLASANVSSPQHQQVQVLVLPVARYNTSEGSILYAVAGLRVATTFSPLAAAGERAASPAAATDTSAPSTSVEILWQVPTPPAVACTSGAGPCAWVIVGEAVGPAAGSSPVAGQPAVVTLPDGAAAIVMATAAGTVFAIS